MFKPGSYNGVYASYGTGVASIILDSYSNIWAYNSENKKFYYINGSNGQILRTIDLSTYNHVSYYAIMDKNGVI